MSYGKSLLAGLVIAVNSLAAQDFPTTKETKQDLNTNLQSKYQHEDSTTTQILNALSGFDTSIFYQDTAKEVVGEQDSVMHKTIWEMNTKYNNPKIELRNHAPDNLPIDPDLFEACYLTGENKILLSLKTQIPTQRHYVCSRISELAHAYQVQRDGLELFYKKELEDISSMEVQGKEYYDLYGTPGTFEYEAHTIIEDTLKKEFIATYTSLCDTNNVIHLSKILTLNAGRFYGYYNIEEAQKYIEKILAIDGEIKDKRIFSNREGEWLAYRFEEKREETKNEKYFESAKMCYLNSIKVEPNIYMYFGLARLYTSKGDLKNAIKYYTLAIPGINRNRAIELVVSFYEENGKYDDALKIYENLAKAGNRDAMLCVAKMYDPQNLYTKKCPYKNQEKKEYRGKKYKEKK